MSYTHSLLHLISLVVAAAAVGCGYPEFESSSHVGELRILGMQSDHAVNAPGAGIHLSALWVDGRTTEPGDVTRAWFKACVNPPEHSGLECIKQLNHLGSSNADGWPEHFVPVYGDQADFTLEADPFENGDEFGTEFYVFAACRGGVLSYLPSANDVLPLACHTPSGAPLGPSDFVVGFRSALVLPVIMGLGNNPIIESFTIGVDTFTPDCVNESCIGFSWPDCEAGQCAGVRACEKAACEPSKVMVNVNPSSAEPDWLASADGTQTERIWARYFVDQGEVEPTLQVIHEPNGQFATQSNSDLLVPPSTTRLWAVVYDSTGGVSWAGLALRAR